jgi:hypothetical protein
MLAKPLLSHILGDDALTRGLGDPEARILVEWLVERAEQFPEDVAPDQVKALCRRFRSIARFVALWCHQRNHGAAIQLAAVERFTWPLPSTAIDPCELMQGILDWEAQQTT